MGKSTRIPARALGAPTRLRRVLDALRAFYGRPKPPISDPFALILYENVAYLADDARREEAFRLLKERTGLAPARILAAPRELLQDVTGRGILPGGRAEKLREIASIALEEFGGDLGAVVRRPPKEAAKALRKFPSIGEPGAEKILLFSRQIPVLALESNGLRVLLRIGYGKEEKSYAASYRSAQRGAAPEAPGGFDALIEGHQLLRRHGQELCRRSSPLCERCPVARECDYYRKSTTGR